MATFQTLGAVTATSSGTAIVGGSNAKSAWTALGTSTLAAKCLYVFMEIEDGTPFLIDVGVGSPGSETVLIPDLLLDNIGPAGAGLQGQLFGPIMVDPVAGIPSSTAVSIRAEVNSVAAGTETADFEVILCDSIPQPELTSYTYASYGFASGADTKWTAIDPGGSAHTKPATFTQITAAAQASIQQIHFHFGHAANGTMTNATWLVDLAIGSEGSETVVVADILLAASTTGDNVTPVELIVRGDSFAGQRISARAQCSIIDATDRIMTVACTTIAGTVVSGGSGGAATLVNSQALVG